MNKYMKKLLLSLLILALIFAFFGCSKIGNGKGSQGTMEEVPELIRVVLMDQKNNTEIVSSDGWIELQPVTQIHVEFKGEVDYIFFYLTPAGTETFAQRERIGVISAYDNDSTGEKGFGTESTTAEFIWTVPNESVRGHLGVELMSRTVAKYEGSVANVEKDASQWKDGPGGSKRIMIAEDDEMAEYMELTRYEDGLFGIGVAGLKTLKEFGIKNEGGVTLNPEEQTLEFDMTKSTGTVTGAIDGPVVSFKMDLNTNKILEKAFRPAPEFPNPEQAQFSGEVLEIPDERLVEIGLYFKGIFDNYL